jgi:GNAT superfamily N-acetyltransferase
MRMGKPQPATLQGRAVRLRPVTADDAPRLTEILTQPEVARWWGRFDLDRVQRELVDPDDGTVTFAIQADGQAIGLIQYWEEPDPDYRHAALDLFLHPDWHGRGLGADAIRDPGPPPVPGPRPSPPDDRSRRPQPAGHPRLPAGGVPPGGGAAPLRARPRRRLARRAADGPAA